MKRIYLDHAAATPLDPHVHEAMLPYLENEFGNPSGFHEEGVRARAAIEKARASIAAYLGVLAEEIIFTGSGTESANLAIAGVVDHYRRTHLGVAPHVITSAIEHHAVLEPIRRLEERGEITLSVLPVDINGCVAPELIAKTLRSETILVALMYANNEIGTIEPVAEVAKVIRKWKKAHGAPTREHAESARPSYPYLYTDACQATNYCELRVNRLGVDLVTLNSSKIYGPKGIGLLCVRRGVSISPQILGGGQERGMRAGTENVAGIVGFAEALHIAGESMEQESSRLMKLRDEFAELIKKHVPRAVINGGMEARLPNNMNVTIPGADHEFLAIALDARGIACSTKSACNELDAETSHVLLALREAAKENGSKEMVEPAGLRFSLGRGTTHEDIVSAASMLGEIVDTLVVSVRIDS